jgi:predicted RNA binding protein YcfA (HicA-like mRNA interferase family)
MSPLPQISGRDCIKALERAGFYVRRQRGSHVVLRRDNPFAQLVVPDHKQSWLGVRCALLFANQGYRYLNLLNCYE